MYFQVLDFQTEFTFSLSVWVWQYQGWQLVSVNKETSGLWEIYHNREENIPLHCHQGHWWFKWPAPDFFSCLLIKLRCGPTTGQRHETWGLVHLVISQFPHLFSSRLSSTWDVGWRGEEKTWLKRSRGSRHFTKLTSLFQRRHFKMTEINCGLSLLFMMS